MELPASLLRSPSGTISATAGTSTTSVLDSAPGPGLRYRLWAWLGIAATLTGTDQLQCAIQDSGNFDDAYCLAIVNATNSGWWQWFPGGIVLATNQAITARVFNGGGSNESVRIIVYYTEEAA